MNGQAVIAQEVETLFRKELRPEMVYHDITHTLETVEVAERLASESHLPVGEKEDLVLAALLHDTGYIKTYEGHEEESAGIARQILLSRGYSKDRINNICALILSTKTGHAPATESEKILYDADHVNMGKKRFFQRSKMFRREFEAVTGKKIPDLEWEKLQLDYLEQHRYHTSYAIEKWGEGRKKNIQKQLKVIQQAERGSSSAQKPVRGIETMYRSVYRTHIDLSSIADSKANMMISINTIMMSIVVAAIGSGFTFTGRSFIEHVRFTIPLCLLVLGGLVSVVFAILSASPDVTSKKVTRKRLEAKKASSIFFGNFTTIEREQFVAEMAKLRTTTTEIYDNMSVDIYDLGVVLRKKYRYLKASYLTFMFSLILTVITFLTLLVFSW